MRIVPSVTIAALLAGLAAGCGGSPEEAPAALEPSVFVPAPRVARVVPAVHEPKLQVPVGFRARRVPEAGAQVAVPAGWIALTRLDAVHPGAVQTLAGIDRRVVGPIGALGVPDSPLKLLVLAPVRDGRFPATITLVVADAGAPQPFGAWARRASAALLSRTQVHGPVSSRHVRLHVGKALRLSYRRVSGGAPAATVAYLALGGGRVYYLALTSRRHEPGFTRAFDTLARSLTTMPGRVGVLGITGTTGKA